MFLIVGLVYLFGSIIDGYLMNHVQIAVLFRVIPSHRRIRCLSGIPSSDEECSIPWLALRSQP